MLKIVEKCHFSQSLNIFSGIIIYNLLLAIAMLGIFQQGRYVHIQI